MIAKSIAVVALVTTGLAVQTGAVSAVSLSVQRACTSDYLSYCSQHPVGSAALRGCMSANGTRLSGRCVNALISAGEVSKAEVSRRAASIRR
ncbi:MAG: hypothetical protein AB7E80_15100 [Hyphomicrobiaceae bacterium]